MKNFKNLLNSEHHTNCNSQMNTNPRKPLYIIFGIGMLIVLYFIFIQVRPIALDKTDTIPMQAMIDTQAGVITQDEQIILPDKVQVKTEYIVHIQYAIINKESDGKILFTTEEAASDNLAYVAGEILETTTSHYPMKSRVNIHLSMISSATPITNEKGEPIDIKKQQLVPIITMEQVKE